MRARNNGRLASRATRTWHENGPVTSGSGGFHKSTKCGCPAFYYSAGSCSAYGGKASSSCTWSGCATVWSSIQHALATATDSSGDARRGDRCRAKVCRYHLSASCGGATNGVLLGANSDYGLTDHCASVASTSDRNCCGSKILDTSSAARSRGTRYGGYCSGSPISDSVPRNPSRLFT